MNRKYCAITILAACLTANVSMAQEDETSKDTKKRTPQQIMSLDPKLGDVVPLNLTFTTSENKVIQLRDYIDKPTILTLVYYKCPGICTPLLNSLSETLTQMEIERGERKALGEDYQVLTISFDPEEDVELAKEKKETYHKQIGKTVKIPEDSWEFCVGTSDAITALTNATGFHYVKNAAGEYNHSATLIVLDDQGKICRYMKGVSYNPFDVKMGIIEASENRVGGIKILSTKIQQFCYRIDPETDEKQLAVTRVFGSLTILLVGGFVGFIMIVRKSHLKKLEQQQDKT